MQAKKYAKINGFKLPKEDCEAILYSFLRYAKFIVLDQIQINECGIIFNIECLKPILRMLITTIETNLQKNIRRIN
jgi:hypothetical protein